MTADVETQNEYDENGLPGPGAPTPISALEVNGPTDQERSILPEVANIFVLYRALPA